MGTGIISLRLSSDLIARIDAVAGERGRSEFARRAFEAMLDVVLAEDGAEVFPREAPSAVKSDAPTKTPVERQRASSPMGSRSHPDDEVFLVAMRKLRRPTFREVKASLGWLGLRAENAEKRLVSSGVLRIEDGVLVEIA